MRSALLFAVLCISSLADADPPRAHFIGNRGVPEAALDALAPANRNLTDQDLELVSLKTSSLYWDLGYVNVKVRETDGTCVIGFLTPECRRSGVVTIQIDEGGQFSIGSVEFRGFPTAVDDMVKIRAGDVFSRTRIVEDRERLEAKFGATVMPMTKRDDSSHTIGLMFELVPKSR